MGPPQGPVKAGPVKAGLFQIFLGLRVGLKADADNYCTDTRSCVAFKIVFLAHRSCMVTFVYGPIFNMFSLSVIIVPTTGSIKTNLSACSFPPTTTWPGQATHSRPYTPELSMLVTYSANHGQFGDCAVLPEAVTMIGHMCALKSWPGRSYCGYPYPYIWGIEPPGSTLVGNDLPFHSRWDTPARPISAITMISAYTTDCSSSSVYSRLS